LARSAKKTKKKKAQREEASSRRAFFTVSRAVFRAALQLTKRLEESIHKENFGALGWPLLP